MGESKKGKSRRKSGTYGKTTKDIVKEVEES